MGLSGFTLTYNRIGRLIELRNHQNQIIVSAEISQEPLKKVLGLWALQVSCDNTIVFYGNMEWCFNTKDVIYEPVQWKQIVYVIFLGGCLAFIFGIASAITAHKFPSFNRREKSAYDIGYGNGYQAVMDRFIRLENDPKYPDLELRERINKIKCKKRYYIKSAD